MPNPSNPQSWNRYSYVSNNPLRYTDPTGHAAVGDTDEAGCSGSGPACIIDMYTSYSDEDGMMDSLRHHVRRHKDYNPVLDPSLSDEERAIVSIAMFQGAVQDTPGDTSLWDIIKATWPSAASLSIFGIIIEGINMSPDDNGGGGGLHISPAESPVWKNLVSYQGKVRRSGSGRDTRYYQWDFTHGDIEVYDRNGYHLGSMHPITGQMYKPAVKGRTINLK